MLNPTAIFRKTARPAMLVVALASAASMMAAIAADATGREIPAPKAGNIAAVVAVPARGEIGVPRTPAVETAAAATELLREAAPVAYVVDEPAPSPVAGARGRVVNMEVTAYCACPRCCGPAARGITASGQHVSADGGRFVAADAKFAFGTRMIVPGYSDGPVQVLDRGGAIKGNKLDVFFDSHEEAMKWGRRQLAVTVFE